MTWKYTARRRGPVRDAWDAPPLSDAGIGVQPAPRNALWAVLMLMVLAALALLIWLAHRYDNEQLQAKAEQAAATGAMQVERRLRSDLRTLETSALQLDSADAADAYLSEHPEFVMLQRRSVNFDLLWAVDSRLHPPLKEAWANFNVDGNSEAACAIARRTRTGAVSKSYFVPNFDGVGSEVLDLCTPVLDPASRSLIGLTVAVIPLHALLRSVSSGIEGEHFDYSFVDTDGTRVASAGFIRGRGIFKADRIVNVPGGALIIRADNARAYPPLVPDLVRGAVLALAIGLVIVVVLLVRDTRRRARVELALAEALSLRQAMEDSLVTGLHARDLDGVTRYVNPAFCAMVGVSPGELLGQPAPSPLGDRHGLADDAPATDTDATPAPPDTARSPLNAAGVRHFELELEGRSGERLPAMVYEAPLRNAAGAQVGWMSAVVDLREQRRTEALTRRQQEKLQAGARLAALGEMSSMLSHELNQPLAAIASFSGGLLNVLEAGEPIDAELAGDAAMATRHIVQQAERAGQIIRSVHDFVRRREQAREAVHVADLLAGVTPLLGLMSRQLDVPFQHDTANDALVVHCARTMIELVLINLVRNAMQATARMPAVAERRVSLQVQPLDDDRVQFAVEDTGPGLAPEAVEHLFKAFYTTNAAGLGLGLSLCRTVIEQHGGELAWSHVMRDGRVAGTRFVFSLPATRQRPPRLTEKADEQPADIR